MAMELIDGFAGAPHISGEDLAALNQGCFGDGDYVFEYGNNLAATVTNANTVHIARDALLSKGRSTLTLPPQRLTTQSATQDQKRNDLVVARYSKASGTNVESTTLAVVRGTPVSYGDAADPDVTANDMKLWRIPIDGITPGTPVQLFEVMKPMSELWDSVSQHVPRLLWSGSSGYAGEIVAPGLSRYSLMAVEFENFMVGLAPTSASVVSAMGSEKRAGNDKRGYSAGINISGDVISVSAVVYSSYSGALGHPLTLNGGDASTITKVWGIA